jgi:hypothetical protein
VAVSAVRLRASSMVRGFAKDGRRRPRLTVKWASAKLPRHFNRQTLNVVRCLSGGVDECRQAIENTRQAKGVGVAGAIRAGVGSARR